MSKLFNINDVQYGGGEEMAVGGVGTTVISYNAEKAIELIKEKKMTGQHFIDFFDGGIVKNEINELFTTYKKNHDNKKIPDKLPESLNILNVEQLAKFVNYIFNSKIATSHKNDIYIKILNNTPLLNTESVDPNGTNLATTAPISTPVSTGASGCIHIGIIDDKGVFVGVQSVSSEDNVIFETLKNFIIGLRKQNEIPDVLTPQTKATIYDKFVENNNTGDCVPTLVEKYITKFWESAELDETFKIYENDKENDVRYVKME